MVFRFHMKSGRFHMKSGGFHEIHRISCEIHPKPYKSKCFNQNYSVWWMQERGYDPGFHEILGHSPLPAPPKLKSFCWNIWFYKVLGGFHMKIWAFAWWPSIGLSFERPNIVLVMSALLKTIYNSSCKKETWQDFVLTSKIMVLGAGLVQ